MDTAELDSVRQAVRTEKEQAAVQNLRMNYGKRLNSQMLVQSRKDVADLLGEEADPVSIHQKLQQLQQKEHRQKHKKEHSQKR